MFEWVIFVVVILMAIYVFAFDNDDAILKVAVSMLIIGNVESILKDKLGGQLWDFPLVLQVLICSVAIIALAYALGVLLRIGMMGIMELAERRKVK